MSQSFRIRKGLNIPVAGQPDHSSEPVNAPEVTSVALCGPDYNGLKPRMRVEVGDSVALGQPLFEDKRDPAVVYASPGEGTVIAIHRGARRALQSVVIGLQNHGLPAVSFEPFSAQDLASADEQDVVNRLLASGWWTAFRTRPYSRVPHSGSRPRSVFVTAMDTRPLSADPLPLIRMRQEAFRTGLNVLSRISQGAVYLCHAPGWDVEISSGSVTQAEFSGPHPAGLAGTHMSLLSPPSLDCTHWSIAYQDVIAIGELFDSGNIDTTRFIALGGTPVQAPRVLRTRLGARISELLAGNIQSPEDCRIISGSPLDGRMASDGLDWLGRYHQQVSVVREGGDKKLFGWAGLFPRRYTAAPTFRKTQGHRKLFEFTTAQNGRFSGMMPLRVFEQVMPLDILPAPLFRALMVKDTDQAQALGCLELDEEDLALCEFVCPAKNDYGGALRINLDQIERDG